MKSVVAIILTATFTSLLSIAQPVRLTGLDRAGNLTWTNPICASQPVYEVLRSGSLTSPWQHWAFVTNQTSLSVSNALDTATGTVFFRVVWVEDSPLVFDYSFTEPEFGLTTVTGRLDFSFTSPGVGWYSFQPTEFFDPIQNQHPIGDRPLPLRALRFPGNGTSLQVYLQGTGGEGSIYLEGTMERTTTGESCVYTRYSGTVWFVGFQTQGIGTFVATRRP